MSFSIPFLRSPIFSMLSHALVSRPRLARCSLKLRAGFRLFKGGVRKERKPDDSPIISFLSSPSSQPFSIACASPPSLVLTRHSEEYMVEALQSMLVAASDGSHSQDRRLLRESSHTKSSHSQDRRLPSHAKSSHTESSQTEPSHTESSQTEPSHSESSHPESSHPESSHPECSQSSHTDSSQPGSSHL